MCRHGEHKELAHWESEWLPQPARLSPSLTRGWWCWCARRGGISISRRAKRPPACTAARRAQFFPQLAVGVTWWLLLLYTPHREWWYYSPKRVESQRAHRRSWNGMMYGPRIINHSFTRGCHPAILQPFRAHRVKREDLLCLLYALAARMNASGRRNRGCHNISHPARRARALSR